MPQTKPGGFGAEAYGDPFGSGGPISVVRALAVAGQVVRVVFTEDPQRWSPAGTRDALNVANYLFSVVDGVAEAPVPVGVDHDSLAWPAYGVGNGGVPVYDEGGNFLYIQSDERGVDVHVDRALVAGVRYRVTVKALVSAAGGDLGAPYSADLSGVTLIQETKRPERSQDLTDFWNREGRWVFDGGDIAPEPPQSKVADVGIRKRALRRLGTQKAAFSWLPDYGLSIPLKGLATTAKMSQLRDEARPQLLREPEARAVETKVSVTGGGLTTVDARIKTRRSGTVPAKLVVDQNGEVVSLG